MTPQLWITLIVAIISGCVGPICVYLFKRDMDRRDTNVKKAEEAKQNEEKLRHDQLQAELKDMMAPVVADVADIKQDLAEQKDDIASVKHMLKDNEEATILELRVDMKLTRDQVVNEGKVLDKGDIATWKELYKRYYQMGGNHFREYVDGWGEEIGLTPDQLQQLKDDAIMENMEEHGR